MAGAWLAHGWRMAGAKIQTATTFLIFGVESSSLGSAIGSSHLETCQEMSPQLQICQVGDLRRERVAHPPYFSYLVIFYDSRNKYFANRSIMIVYLSS